jgi:Baseplate J-like protein
MASYVNYTSRNFADIRSDLVNYVKQYYPNIFNDFNDASVGMMLLELNAAVGDMLSFNTDRMFQETQLNYAQQRSSLLSLARTFGLKIPGKRPSFTIVDFSVTLPVYGTTFDVSYAPVIQAGAQVNGGGKVFETLYDIDFSEPFSIGGIPNRLIIPNFNSNGTLANYTITKRELVINGYSKIFKRVLSISDVVPFLEIVLPDNNITSIEQVITLAGTNYTTDPTNSQFLDPNNQWYEVDALAEDKIFIEDFNTSSNNPSIRVGKYVTVNKKFITEYTDLGFLKLIFGGGTQDISSLSNYNVNQGLVNQIGDFINNMSLGQTLSPNTTLFVKYRVGGGYDSNLGQGVINSVGLMNMIVNGSNQTINNSVKNSLSVNNPIPALGGRDEPSIEEVRNLIRYNFSAQNRAVTLKDYQSRIQLMPGKYGVPFRVGVQEEQNKIQVYILGLDSNGNLNNTSNTTLKDNIATYLSDYRMLNDYIQVNDGRIVNLSFQIDVFVDKNYSQSSIISQVVTDVTNYMDVNNFDMGENIYLGNLYQTINSVKGVLNVIEIRVYNNVGGSYSTNEITQPYLDTATRQVYISDNYTLFGEPNTMFEIKYPQTDIVVRTK